MENEETLTKKCEEIDNEVRKLYKYKKDNDINPIFDGVINVGLYLKSKFKILWILKEPYDAFDENNEPKGGGWDFKEVLNKKQKKEDFGKSFKTFQNMIYISWAIANDFKQWKDIPNIEKNPIIINSLKATAFINIKKTPGKTKSNPVVISKAFKDYGEILLHQIENYNPDIIIFGGTMLDQFRNDLNIDISTAKHAGDFVSYFIKDKKIYISTNHPSYPKSTENEEEYCDGIINAAKEWSKQK